MNTSSNQLAFATLTGDYPAILLASGSAAGTATSVTSGATNASIITDILFRNLDTANARNFDICIGSTASAQNKIVQVAIPANAGNNGSTSLASLAALAPSIFDLDLAGNRVLTLESGTNIYVVNTTALTANIYVMAKRRSF